MDKHNYTRYNTKYNFIIIGANYLLGNSLNDGHYKIVLIISRLI